MGSNHHGNVNYGAVLPGQQPVLTQPVVNQPMKTNWNAGPYEMCRDTKHCLCVFCFGSCYLCCHMKRIHEHCCTACCLGQTGLIAVRAKMRGQYNIKGGICADSCYTCWCHPCAMCQTINEMDYRGI